MTELCLGWSVKRLDNFCLVVHDTLRVLGGQWPYLEWKQRFRPNASEATASRAWEHLKKGLVEMGVEFSLLEQRDHAVGRKGERPLQGRRTLQFQSERGVVKYLRETIGYDYMEVA